jgi:serine/arginine repetitive matrix protein 1
MKPFFFRVVIRSETSLSVSSNDDNSSQNLLDKNQRLEVWARERRRINVSVYYLCKKEIEGFLEREREREKESERKRVREREIERKRVRERERERERNKEIEREWLKREKI